MFEKISSIMWLIIIVLSIVGFIFKILTKRRMSESLGRKATDDDLSSISAWMKVKEKEKD